jgi:hypothetical protein
MGSQAEVLKLGTRNEELEREKEDHSTGISSGLCGFMVMLWDIYNYIYIDIWDKSRKLPWISVVLFFFKGLPRIANLFETVVNKDRSFHSKIRKVVY